MREDMITMDYEVGWGDGLLLMYFVQYILFHLMIPLESNYIDEAIVHEAAWMVAPGKEN